MSAPDPALHGPLPASYAIWEHLKIIEDTVVKMRMDQSAFRVYQKQRIQYLKDMETRLNARLDTIETLLDAIHKG